MPWVTVYTDTAPGVWSSTMCTLSRDGSTCVYGFATSSTSPFSGLIKVAKNNQLALSFNVVGGRQAGAYPGYGLAISADGTIISATGFVKSDALSHIFTTSPISLPIESHILASQGATFTQSIQGTRANFTDLYSSNLQVGQNFGAKLLQLSNIAYQASQKSSFTDGPYTTALSSDGTTLVLGYTDRIDIFDIGSQTVVFTYNQKVYSTSINASANVVVAGDASTSSVYIYRKTTGTWAYETTITRTNYFGFSVSLNAVGDKFLASSLAMIPSGGSGGDSYMYTYNGRSWGGPTTTFPKNATYVALSGDGTTCVFGIPSYTDAYSSSGAVLVTKDFGTTYTPYPGDAEDDWFGYHVSCSYDGSTIIANSEPSGYGLYYVKIILNGNVRKITYNFPSGACAVSPDGLSVAYGISGGYQTDSVNIIKNYGTVNETTLVIHNPGTPSVFYGYGISLDNNGTKVSATGISDTYYQGGGGSGTGHLYDIITVPSVIDITASGNSLNVLGGLNTSGNVVISGNSTLNGLEIRAVNYIRVESSITYNLSATISTNILLIPQPGLSRTLNMPTSPVDGQITSFTVQLYSATLIVGTGTVSQSFAGSAAPGATYKYVYSSAYDTWFGI